MATFKLSGSPLPSTFKGNPQQLYQAMLSRMQVESDGSLFTDSDTAPSGNQGPWLKGGTKWYVWDAETSSYVPLDVSDSVTFQISVADKTTPPDPGVYQFWLKTSGATILGLFYFVGTTSGWQPVFSEELINDSVATAMLQDGAVTAQKIASKAVGSDELADDLPVGKLDSGQSRQLLSTVGTTPQWVSLIIASSEQAIAGSGSTISAQTITVNHDLAVVPNIVRWVLRCKTAEFGYSVGDEVDLLSTVTANSGKSPTTAANASHLQLILQGTLSILRPDSPTGAVHITVGNWVAVAYYAAA